MPEALLARIIRTASNPDDVVLDPFAGSGTTLVAANKLNRCYLGIEISKLYTGEMKQRLTSAERFRKVSGRKKDWPARLIEEANTLYMESGVSLDRIAQNEYLLRVLAEQLRRRLTDTSGGSGADHLKPEDLLDMLEQLRRTNQLSKTLVLDDAKSYSTPKHDLPKKERGRIERRQESFDF